MTKSPKEKAVELINKFTIYTKFLDEFKGWIEHSDSSKAKQFALIAVNEIIDSHNNIQNFLFNEIGYLITRPEYWQEVKEEIEKL